MLPDVLAGPILRRSDRSGVLIWIATSRHLEMEAVLYRVTGTAESFRLKPLATSSRVTEARLGERLFV